MPPPPSTSPSIRPATPARREPAGTSAPTKYTDRTPHQSTPTHRTPRPPARRARASGALLVNPTTSKQALSPSGTYSGSGVTGASSVTGAHHGAGVAQNR